LVVGDEKQPVEAENLVDAGHNEDQEVFEVETFTHWLEAHIDWVGDVIDYCCGERLEYEEQLKDIVSPTRHFSNGLVVLPNNDEEWWKMFSAEISAQFKVDVASMSIALVEMKETSMTILNNSDCGETYRSKYKEDYDILRITKFKYHVRKSTKIATMSITRNNQPLNYKIYKEFRLKMLEFTEWLELHELASKKQGPANN
ncbi:hypothetical protein Tco_1115701, partial [Tanacetum coccineum]